MPSMPSTSSREVPRHLQASRGGLRRSVAMLIAIGVVGAGLSALAIVPAQAAVGDTVTGTVWQDYDSNGILDTFEDSGRLAGVEVRAYDGAGNVAGPVTTAADGTYSLQVTSDAARWRVEASVPDTPQWNGWKDSAVGRTAGTSNGTTVQFVDVPDGGTAGVDFSFQVPGAYVENNPLVFLPAYRYGASDGAQGGLFGGTAHLYDAMSAHSQGTVPTTWNVPFNEVGATFGTAWQQAPAPGALGTLFASAYVRRHSGFGPSGIGAIYRVFPDDGTATSPTASASLLVDLAARGIDLGSDNDPGAVTGDPNGLRPAVTSQNPAYDWRRDAQAWDKVGRVGLGGMEISTDQRYLFAVNLHHRSLVRVEVDRTGANVIDVQEFELDAYFPDSSDLRPFGLSSNPLTNELYLTATNTAETSGDRADLSAHVYAFFPEDPTTLREVLEFPLGYDRGTGWGGFDADYQPWSTDPADYAPYYNGDVIGTSVPVVSDARFLHGDLVIGIRALDGDVFGSYTYLSDSPTDMRIVRARTNGGELLLAGGNGDGTFTIEQNGVVNGVAGAGAGAGALLNGPTGPNKYFIDQWWQGPEHLGAVLVVPSRPDGVLETGIHVAEGAYQVGTRRLFQGDGRVVDPRGAAIVTGTNVLGVTTKGNGLGELTALASAAPIEIGNYVWYDVDNDGVQDPDEAPVPGATVNLYEVDAGGVRTLVSSTTTSAIGEYYFSSNPALNANGYALETGTEYVVGVDHPADYAEVGPLFGWSPTTADTGDALSPEPDRNDSDGLVEETDAGAFPFAVVTTGDPGENDHTIDFGFSQVDYEFTKRTVSGPTENPDDDGTWSLSYELVVENPSDVNGSYLLTDDLSGYGEGIEVVGTEVVAGPAGAALNTAWDGLADQSVITDRLPIAAGSTEAAGTAHVYTLEVTVRLASDAVTGEAVADASELACGPDQSPGGPTTGLFNVATLDPSGHEDIADDECADLPLVSLVKSVEVEPRVVDRAGEPGLWEVVYGLEVTNESDVETDYDLTDRLRFGSAVEIESVEVANVEPGGIETNAGYDGVDEVTVVGDEPIAGGATHVYEVTVRYSFDLPNPPAQPDASDCSLVEGGEDGTGLLNGAATSFNGYRAIDSECRELGQATHEKSLVSATPIGDGRWQVEYDLTVQNLGTGATLYDLDDTLRYTDETTVVSAVVTSAPAGVTPAAWDGATQTRIASAVPLAGNDDPAYAPHVYRLTVVAEVPLQLDGAGSDEGTDPARCAADGEDASLARALTNTSSLTDEAGQLETDAACAALPSIEIGKTVSNGPIDNGDGTWTVTYDIVATNDGGAAGLYEVTDGMTADGDLVIESATVTASPDGVVPAATWTGLGAEGAPENVIASGVSLPSGAVHTYRVEVVVLIENPDAELVVSACAAAGESGNGGLSNVGGIEHNDESATAEACVALAYVVVDKRVSDGPVANGDGTWTITYDLDARNVGAATGSYDIADRLEYGDGVEIVSADVVGTPDGVDAEETWTGLGSEPDAPENLIAESVELAAGGLHTYRVQVVVEMDESTIDPAALACPPPGSGEAGGLANTARLNHNGIIHADDVCASLPLIRIAKTISEGPTPNGDGTWTTTYDLVASNVGGAEGVYDLADRLRHGIGIVVESADVTTTPDGVTDPSAWTGQGVEGAVENEIAADVALGGGASHTYRAQVVVSLDEATVTPEDLACPPAGSDARRGLANTVELSHNGEVSDAEACAPLPLIEITKSLSGAVVPVDGQDGVYDVTYEVTVTNRGPGVGAYDLDDELAPGEGVTIEGIESVSTTAPASVGLNPDFDGLTDVRIVTGQPIAGAAGTPVTHEYAVVVRYAAELGEIDISPADSCTDASGTVAGGLNNVAGVTWNGLRDTDEECVRPGKPTLDKALVSASPVGGGQWQVVYDLTIGNVGHEATTYDLDDELRFAEAVTVDTVEVAGPDGVAIDAAFDGGDNARIATDVGIAGLDDDGYAPHVYRVTVTADVPLAFDAEEIGEDGTGSPACTAPAGSNLVRQGLNNAATLTDETGDTVTDTDCAALPSIDIAKSVAAGPVRSAGGSWTITYDIVASNTGAAAGVYTVVDRLRYGAGIEVAAAQVVRTPDGVTAAGTWTGQGADGDPVNVIAGDVTLPAGGTHAYQVRVVAEVDVAASDASTFACPEPGSSANGGFANTAGLSHNDLTDSAVACAAPERPAGAIASTGVSPVPALLVATMLLLLGAAVVVVSGRRAGTRPSATR